MHAFGKFRIRDAPVLLQQAQDGPVARVKIDWLASWFWQNCIHWLENAPHIGDMQRYQYSLI
jgi:hypothetical protein